MADALERRDWCRRVLDVEVGLGAGAALARPLLPIWTDAKEALDADVEKLQQALKGSDDPDFRQIGEYGLHGVTQGHTVKLMAALREADAAKGGPALSKAYDAVQSYQDFLDASPGVDVIEQNPLNIPVAVRAKLGAALDEIKQALRG